LFYIEKTKTTSKSTYQKNRQKIGDMNKSIVALVPCKNYDEELVNEKVKLAISLLGGLSSIIKKDEKVLVKPNLLFGCSPNKAITTHPAVFGAVLKALKEEQYQNVLYGDSNGKPISDVEKTAQMAGLEDVAQKYGVGFADFKTEVNVAFKTGKVCKRFPLCKAVVDADAIISVCKMKTHALEKITGAVKNQYGCVFGPNKAIGHALYPDSNSFAKMIVDLNMCIKPRLYIMDGIIAMEGNGPSSGNPVMMNVVLASKDPVALDSVYAKLINLNPSLVPTIVHGERMGLGKSKYSDISIVTPDGEISADEALAKYGNKDFDVNRKEQKFWIFKALFLKSQKPKHKPVVDLDKCVACGVCEESCPVEGKAVHSGNGKKAEYEYDKCIRCYCCQEMCPARAISRQE